MPAKTKPRSMTVAEIESAFPGEWVVLEITRDARKHENVRGRLIAHNPDRHRAHDSEMAFVRKHPEAITYGFHTARTVPDDVVIVL